MADIYGEVEIVFVGLCSFVNLRNTHNDLPNPSVILVQTDKKAPHVPFIAFDTREVTVSDDTDFKPVRYAEEFLFCRLDGVHVRIDDDFEGTPVVAPTYDLVAKRDVYWPSRRRQWDPDYIPASDRETPSAARVAAWMHFGGGTISAECLTDVEWRFAEDGEETARGFFAQEVIYRLFPRESRELTLTFQGFNGGDAGSLTFTSNRASSQKVRIWIGNADASDIHKAILRLSSLPSDGLHFRYLNAVSGGGSEGPIPTPVVLPNTPMARAVAAAKREQGEKDRPAGGYDTGYCGPHNANHT